MVLARQEPGERGRISDNQLPIASCAMGPPPSTTQCRGAVHCTVSELPKAPGCGTGCTVQCRPPSKLASTTDAGQLEPTATHSEVVGHETPVSCGSATGTLRADHARPP